MKLEELTRTISNLNNGVCLQLADHVVNNLTPAEQMRFLERMSTVSGYVLDKLAQKSLNIEQSS